MTLYEARFDDKPTVTEEASNIHEFIDRHPKARLYTPVAIHDTRHRHPDEILYGR